MNYSLKYGIIALLSSAVLSLATLTNGTLAHAAEKGSAGQTIRFYKINKDDITQKILFTNRKARNPGCHNFVKKVRLHRTVQLAYEHCQVFSKKNCATDSVMTFFKKDAPEIQLTKLAQGFGWYPAGEHPRGEKVKSWSCQ